MCSQEPCVGVKEKVDSLSDQFHGNEVEHDVHVVESLQVCILSL